MKNINTRICQKHDLEAEWIKNCPDFIPMKGELIVFDAEVTSTGKLLSLPEGRSIPYSVARTKIGDGVTNVIALPFVSSQVQIITWEDND